MTPEQLRLVATWTDINTRLRYLTENRAAWEEYKRRLNPDITKEELERSYNVYLGYLEAKKAEMGPEIISLLIETLPSSDTQENLAFS